MLLFSKAAFISAFLTLNHNPPSRIKWPSISSSSSSTLKLVHQHSHPRSKTLKHQTDLIQHLTAHAHARTILTHLPLSSLRSVLHDQHGPGRDHQGECPASDYVWYLWTTGLRFSRPSRRASVFAHPSRASQALYVL